MQQVCMISPYSYLWHLFINRSIWPSRFSFSHFLCVSFSFLPSVCQIKAISPKAKSINQSRARERSGMIMWVFYLLVFHLLWISWKKSFQNFKHSPNPGMLFTIPLCTVYLKMNLFLRESVAHSSRLWTFEMACDSLQDTHTRTHIKDTLKGTCFSAHGAQVGRKDRMTETGVKICCPTADLTLGKGAACRCRALCGRCNVCECGAQRETHSLWLSDLEPSFPGLVCSTNTNPLCVSFHVGRLHTLGLQSFLDSAVKNLSPSKLVINDTHAQIGML